MTKSGTVVTRPSSGGCLVLDAVERALELRGDALDAAPA
jgi:hypothetical protein